MKLTGAFLAIAFLLSPFACARLNHPAPVDPSVITGTQGPALTSKRSLRIATYNDHMESAEKLVSVIKGNANLREADLLLLQEIEAHESEGSTRAEQIAEALGMNFAYAPGYQLRSGGSHGVAVLSRLPLQDVQRIELPYYHVVVNSAPRVALAVTVTLDEQALRVFSVHLDNRINPHERLLQMQPVLRAAADFPGPVIVAGDLNTSPFCWAGNLVPIPCGWQDNAMELGAKGYGLQSPVAGVGATSKWLAMKLDAIYTRGLAPGASAVERGVRLSDHLPMWLDLELPAASGS